MVNHFRTHLLNVTRGGNSLLTAGEEYISSKYRPRREDALMRYMRAALFGNNPDREYLNLRGRQLLELVHASGLADYTTFYDPRITYLPWKATLPTATSQKLTINKITGVDGVQLITTGPTQLSDPGNKSRHIWKITYENTTSSDTFTLGIKRQTNPAITYPVETYSFLPGSGSSELIPLPGTPLKLSINDTLRNSGGPVQVVSANWNLEILAIPTADISAALYQLYANSGEYISNLFPANGTELQQSLLQVMVADRSILNKYAAILLGLAEYTTLQPQMN
jgi:hypothetical protein